MNVKTFTDRSHAIGHDIGGHRHRGTDRTEPATRGAVSQHRSTHRARIGHLHRSQCRDGGEKRHPPIKE